MKAMQEIFHIAALSRVETGIALLFGRRTMCHVAPFPFPPSPPPLPCHLVDKLHRSGEGGELIF